VILPDINLTKANPSVWRIPEEPMEKLRMLMAIETLLMEINLSE
jgi:hypothetical protein